MKTLYNLLILLVCSLLTESVYGADIQISESDALNIAKREFQGKDVQYYSCTDFYVILSDNWKILVDAEPMKGWEHKAYILTIPKKSSTSAELTKPISIEETNRPPKESYKLLASFSGYDMDVVFAYPQVENVMLTNEERLEAQRTYAIIISGGVRPLSNYQRYWNDCSFIFKTLVNKYGVPTENIFPIMSDGTNLADDMITTFGTFMSQPLDLNQDGVNDIKMAATRANIQNTLQDLAIKLEKNDHLFIFVIDHGGTRDNKSQSYINLWGEETLDDYELANLLKPITAKYVNVNVVLGQCFAGGFVDDLQQIGCVVSTACKGNEYSYGCSLIPFDEFVYHWTCAVNGADYQKNPINADSDNNGHVSMKEAFEYAYYNDLQRETPQYSSTPISVGEDLAFDYIPPTIDIYLKDNEQDTGKEPNTTTDIHWNSSSIWVRNEEDGKTVHENPVYTESHKIAYIYYRIYNRGREDYNGGLYLHPYWASSSLAIPEEVWYGYETYPNEYGKNDPDGGHLTVMQIDPIPVGKFIDIAVPWPMPRVMASNPDEHFCLLGKISSSSYAETKPSDAGIQPLLRKTEAQKNVTIIRGTDTSKKCKVFIRNIKPTQAVYSIEVKPNTTADAMFFETSNIELGLGKVVYQAWELGGKLHEDVEFSTGLLNDSDIRPLFFVSEKSCLKALSLGPKVTEQMSVKFNFDKKCNTTQKFVFHIVQKDENGDIVGGETYDVYNPYFTIIPINPDPIISGEYALSIEEGKYTSLKWTDEEDNILGTDENIIVKPSVVGNTYYVSGVMSDGIVANGSITLSPDASIKSVYVSKSGQDVKVELTSAATEDSKITVSSLWDGTEVCETLVDEGESSISINTESLKKGMYVVSYYIRDEIKDRKKVNIQ